MNLELLLAHADDSAPVLSEGLPLDAAASAPRPVEQQGPSYLRYDSADPSSLPEQRWGIVAPEGPEGDRLLALVEPLRKARQEGQGGAPVRVYRVPAEMSAEAAARWKSDVYWDEAVPEEDLPRYLLVLGDADRVSLELQQILASDVFTGRLAFNDDRGYESYVDKVLRWERNPSEEARARALFYTVHDGTAATSVGYSALMTPSLALSRERSARGTFHAKDILEIGEESGGSGESLFEEARSRSPAVLFSISHGLGAPRRGWKSADEQRALQGAMSLGSSARVAGEDLVSRPFLPGGFWFFLACYGAGTPGRSAYRHWLEGLRAAGSFGGKVDSVLAGLPGPGARPFVASLPQAVLANPDGPLAVIGHLDLAWTYAFQDLGPVTRSRPSRFQGVFRSIVGGARAGVAHAELMRFFTEASVELSVLHDEDARAADRALDDAERTRRANLWMLRQDLAGYVLLGDPAVRLPISAAGGAAAERPAPAAAPATPDLTAAATAMLGGVSTSGGGPGRDPAAMEEAVIEVLSGDVSEKEIAQNHSISRAELKRWVDAYRSAGREALRKLR